MEEENKPAVVPHGTSFMDKPMASPDHVVRYNTGVRELITKSMKEGIDYGKVPKTDKKTLFKAGAELIVKSFNARTEYELMESEKDHNCENFYNDRYGNRKSSFGLYRYVYKCYVKMPDGTTLGEGDGSCSSLEQKYIYSPRNNENTVLKMAQKRALVSATLNAFALSDRFNQDLEEGAPPKSYTPPPAPAQQGASEIYTETDAQKKILATLGKQNKITEQKDLIAMSAAIKGTEMIGLDKAVRDYAEGRNK